MSGLLIVFVALLLFHDGAAAIACNETGWLCGQIVFQSAATYLVQRDFYPFFLALAVVLLFSGAKTYMEADPKAIRWAARRVGLALIGVAAFDLATGNWMSGLGVLMFGLSLIDPASPTQHVRLSGFALALLAFSFVFGRWGVGLFGASLGLALASHRVRGAPLRRAEATAQVRERSTVRTAHLEVWRDPITDTIGGHMIAGRFAGAPLHALSFADLLEAREDCFDDSRSLDLIETYLSRRHPDWRERVRRRADPELPTPGRMTESVAYEILGLKPGVDEQTVIQAHRALIRRVHPDQGGTTYVASLVNEARDFLVRKRRGTI